MSKSKAQKAKELHGHKMRTLVLAANEMAIRFISPIYLVGSYLKDPDNAKDIDLLMVVTEERFKRLFGCESPGFNMAQYEFRKKQKLYLEDYTEMDIDFKVVTEKRFRRIKERKLKLDTYAEFPE